MTKKLQVGLIGCGSWGRHILRDLLSLGCDVTVVSNSETGRQNARDGGATEIVESVGHLPLVSGVIVATPTSTHAEVIESLLELNVPIFTEKPLTADRESAFRLAGQAPDRLFVMDKWRYHPGIEMLRDIARAGELGPVVGLRTTRAQWGNPHADVDICWILMPHDLSIALEVFGKIPMPRYAVAEKSGNQLTTLLGILGGDLDSPGEPWLIVEVSSRHPQHHREIRLHCRDGVAILDDGYSPGISVTRSENLRGGQPPASELRPISQELPLLRELRAFVEHLQGGPPPRSSAAEGAQVVNAIAGLRELAGLDKE
ncbi:MAG TPA: Gfo/Idh/MocA family oxidoreductase [Pyrinomonadaceae bacterium]|jgi:predicted dehydrogenase